MILTATRPVLLASIQYKAGDALPCTNEELVAAWIECGSAVWVDEDQTPEAPAPKARPAAAEAGLPGLSSDGDPDALVGKVPARQRKKKA